MLELNPLCEAKLQYMDHHGRVAQLRLRYPSSVPYTEVYSRAMQIHARIAPLSSAVLTEVKVQYGIAESDPGMPVSGIPAQEALVLFYRNGEDYDAVYVPGPLPQLWETVGDYAGIRLDMGNSSVAPLVESLNLALGAGAGAVFVSMGAEFVVGGRAI